MSDLEVFGPIVDGADVERALLAHLREWMPTYVPAVRRLKDPDAERWPEGVKAVEEFTVKHAAADNWPEDQLPMLLAHCPNDGGKPRSSGDGQVSARFTVVLSAIASGYDENDARELARLYASAANMAILQNPDLGDFAEGVEWQGWQNMPVTRGVEAERFLMAVANVYVIDVTTVLNRSLGPSEPLKAPETEPDDLPRVKEGGGHLELETGAEAVELLRSGGFFEDE